MTVDCHQTVLAETEAKVVSAVPPRIVDMKGAQGEVVGRIAEVVGGVRPIRPGITGTADGIRQEDGKDGGAQG